MTRVAIIAAMPGELKPLVRGWQAESRSGVHLWRHHRNRKEWIAACAGAGQPAATRAFAEIEKDGPIDSVISTGWAGALSEEFAVGRAYWLSGVVDVLTGERFPTASKPAGPWLATSPKVAGKREKQRLSETYGAGLVDMEAAAIARLAQMRGIPFSCVKGISDAYTEQLPDFNRFIRPDGGFKLTSFILFSILRPHHWLALVRMGENSRRAAQGIAESLLETLDE
jgi:adenosylhomocysteine nucleosidase